MWGTDLPKGYKVTNWEMTHWLVTSWNVISWEMTYWQLICGMWSLGASHFQLPDKLRYDMLTSWNVTSSEMTYWQMRCEMWDVISWRSQITPPPSDLAGVIWQVQKEWFGKNTVPNHSDLCDLATKTPCRITLLGCDLATRLAESLWFGIWLGVIWQNVTESLWFGIPKGSDLVWFGNIPVGRIGVIWHSEGSDLVTESLWFGIFRGVIWSESQVIWLIWHLVGLGDFSWVTP